MKRKHCWKCKGTGNYEEEDTCPVCGGAGKITHIFPEELNLMDFKESDDPDLLSTVHIKGYY